MKSIYVAGCGFQFVYCVAQVPIVPRSLIRILIKVQWERGNCYKNTERARMGLNGGQSGRIILVDGKCMEK